MKYFLLVLLFGLAVALPYDGYYRDEDEEDIKTELGKKLKESLEHILNKIKDAIDHGKDVKDELFDKVKEIKEKLKDLHIEVKGKVKEALEKVRNKIKDYFRKLLEGDDSDVSRRDIKDKLKDLLRKLKERLQDAVDKGKIEEFIKEKVPEGKLRNILLRYLEKGRKHLQRLIDFLDRRDDDDSDVSRRDIKDKLKNFVRKLKEKMQEIADDEKIKEFIETNLPKGMLQEILLRRLEKGREFLQRLIDLMDRGDDD